MKKILAFALALMLAIPAMAFADGRDADITALGTATVTADPNQVTVIANASVTAKTVGETQEAMNKIITSVTDKLTQLGVQQNDIVTSSYSYYPVYNYDTDTPTIKGYQANHTLCITCNDVEMLDSVVGAVTDSGMSDICSVSYDVSNRSDLYKQALELAIDAAAKKGGCDGECGGHEDHGAGEHHREQQLRHELRHQQHVGRRRGQHARRICRNGHPFRKHQRDGERYGGV